jgi:AcrR family transcriptional regulator
LLQEVSVAEPTPIEALYVFAGRCLAVTACRSHMDTPDGRLGRNHPRAKRGGRSERVVRDVLRAVAVELANAGYAALRVDDVAVRAGVNKTTIYRRWPTKVDLIRDFLRSLGPAEPKEPDTGSVRADLLHLLVDVVAFASTPEGQGVLRMLNAEMDNPEIQSLSLWLRNASHAPWIAAITRGIKRGELPAGTDAQILVEMIISTVLSRILFRRDEVNDALLLAVVDTVVLGAKAGGAVPVPSLRQVAPLGRDPGAGDPSATP